MDAVAAGILGSVAGNVRGAQQTRDAVGLHRDLDDADARSDAAGGLLPDEAVVANALADVVGDPRRLLGGAVSNQDAEFIAAQACDGVGTANVRLQQTRDIT